MSMEKVIKTVNGVNVDAVNSTVEAIKGNPDIAKFKFHLGNKWINGAFNRSTISSFYGANQENTHLTTFKLDTDEPAMLVGEDNAANPVEYLLHALSSCLTTTLVYHAAIRDITIDELESEVEGDIDLRGFLGLAKEVRKGYQNIRVKFKVKTDEENIAKLKALCKFYPVFDVVSHGTNVDVQIERK